MRALIDADRYSYAYGGFKNEDGDPLDWPLVAERIDSAIQSVLDAIGSNEYTLYLTEDDKSNFRIQVATIRAYKGHRSSDKPFWYEQIRRYLISRYDAMVVNGVEADDAIGITACSGDGTVMVSVDKDLDNIPGKHFNELKPQRGIYEISEIDSLRNFYCQCLTGDSTDNIPGLFGVGRASALCKFILTLDEESDMYSYVREQYEKRFGSYWKAFMYENAHLLYILRTNDTREVFKRFEKFEKLSC